MNSDILKDRKPEKNTVDFLVILTDELRLAGKHSLATELERCFRFTDKTAAAFPAIRMIVEKLT